MAQISQPTKQQIRRYLARRVKSHKPPPDLKEVRRHLGWELIEMERNGTRRR